MKKCWIIAILTTVVSLFVVSDANAFGRRCGGRIFVSRSCTPCISHCAPHIAPVVVKEFVPVLAYPVLVPAFQFQYVPQAYAPTIPVVPVTGYPVASPIIQPVAPYGQPVGYGVPGQAAIPANPYGQYANGNGNGNGYGLNNKDKIRELAKALLEEMSRMSENGPVDSGPPVVPGNQPVGQAPFFPQPQQPQPNAQFAIAAMQRTCAQCHTGVGSKGDMVIFTQPGILNQQTNWKKIKEELNSGRMPPKDVHFQLAPQERQNIIQWLTSIGVN